MRRLADLWHGRLPLAEAFWVWAVCAGLILNVAATALMLAALAADLPGGVALAVHLVPAPYNVAVAIAVWRSAGRYEGPQFWADMARTGAIAWAICLMLL